MILREYDATEMSILNHDIRYKSSSCFGLSIVDASAWMINYLNISGRIMGVTTCHIYAKL